MTYEQGAKIAARAVAFYLLIWVIFDLIDLPRQTFSLMHEWHSLHEMHRYSDISSNLSSTGAYLLRSSILFLLSNVVHILLLISGVSILMAWGPRIQRFFGCESEVVQSPHSSN